MTDVHVMTTLLCSCLDFSDGERLLEDSVHPYTEANDILLSVSILTTDVLILHNNKACVLEYILHLLRRKVVRPCVVLTDVKVVLQFATWAKAKLRLVVSAIVAKEQFAPRFDRSHHFVYSVLHFVWMQRRQAEQKERKVHAAVGKRCIG